MTHYYGQPIPLARDAHGQPSHFTWRGQVYPILELLATWHLRDRWWATGTHGASDRTYYRVRCAGELYAELYYDAADERWILDRIYD